MILLVNAVALAIAVAMPVAVAVSTATAMELTIGNDKSGWSLVRKIRTVIYLWTIVTATAVATALATAVATASAITMMQTQALGNDWDRTYRVVAKKMTYSYRYSYS